jgi:hypothetical protein
MGRQLVFLTVLCALAGALLGSCSTANVSGTAGPLFDSSDIAPLNLTTSSTADGGWEMDIVTRGVQLDEAVVVFTDGVTEVAHLNGVTEATLTSNHDGTLACVMVKVRKGDYWYFDNGKSDYWYFDSAGQMMPESVGEQWYVEAGY